MGWSATGLGAISMGRGGTNLGFADNGAIINDNPGAMSNVAGDGLFDASADALITDLHYSDPQNNDVAGKTRPFVTPSIGYIRKIDDTNWTWGIGAFVPAGFGADYTMDTQPPIPGPQQYKSIGGVGKLLGALSYKVTDRLSIGGTLGIGFSDVQITAPYVIQTMPGFAGAPTLLGLHSWGVTPVGGFGAEYLWSEDTVLGLNYIAPSTFNLAGGAGVNVLGVGYSHFDANVHITWPSSISFGIRHNLCPHRIISAEVLAYNWSGAFTNLPITLSNPSNFPFTAIVPPGGIKDFFPLGWSNSVSLRLGYQWMPDDVNIYRLGYVYHASPVPNFTLNPLTDGVLQHTFTAGYSRKFDRAQFNVGYQFSFAPTRDVGASGIIGPGGGPGDFANSQFRASIHYLSMGFLIPF